MTESDVITIPKADCSFKLKDVLNFGHRFRAPWVDDELRARRATICVYVVRDGNRIIYIGSTGVRITNRLRQHMIDNSKLGQLIESDRFVSKMWDVDVYPMPDRKTAYKVEHIMQKELMPELGIEGRRG